MKILYLRLINSAGIWAGAKRQDIEINFNESKNNIIMLFGGNGSGKTTILSSLNPFCNSTNDDRKNFFRKGKEGFKEIHYLHDDKVYMIRHYVKKQTKSYMTVIDYDQYLEVMNETPISEIFDNYGEELNENGGVQTFKELVENKLGVTEDYFKISRIGSNVNNFIDLSVSERKKYISLFLPNVDEYLYKYKVVNEKFKILNKEIKFISDEILKLDNEENLRTDLDRVTNQYNDIKSRLEKLDQSINKNLGKISILDKDNKLKDNDYENPYEEKLNESTERYFKLKKNLSEDCSLDDLTKEITKTEKRILELEGEYNTKKSELNSVNELKISNYDSMQDKEKQLKGIDVDDLAMLNKLKEKELFIISEIEGELSELETSLKESGFNLDESELDRYVIKDYKNNLNELQKLYKKYIDLLNDDDLSAIRKALKRGFNKTTIDSLNNDLEISRNEMNRLDEEISVKTNELAIKISHLDQLSILEKRPSTCSDDECEFIKNALKYKNLNSEIEELDEQISKLREAYSKEDTQVNYLTLILSVITPFKEFSYEANLKNLSTEFNKIFSDDYISVLKFLINNDLTTITSTLSVSNIANYYQQKDELNVEKEKLNKIEEKIKNNSKIEKIRKDYEKEISEFKEKYEKANLDSQVLKDELSDINDLLSENKVNLESLKLQEDAIHNFDSAKKEYSEIQTMYDEANDILEKINDLAVEIGDLKKERKELKTEVPELEEDISAINLKLEKLKEYSKRKENLDSKYAKYSLVKDALNPTKGIPVFFISDYLNKTQKITNDLLDISQSGKFAIKFSIDDKNFFIGVLKDDGDELEDINLASQGEISLTTLSLSLALMEQSMSIYNIFYLDELDGALDDHNRKAFISMVENQMASLGSEQVFIISHNKEFDYYPVDMILMKDHSVETNNKEFMSNKKIIFEA